MLLFSGALSHRPQATGRRRRRAKKDHQLVVRGCLGRPADACCCWRVSSGVLAPSPLPSACISVSPSASLGLCARFQTTRPNNVVAASHTPAVERGIRRRWCAGNAISLVRCDVEGGAIRSLEPPRLSTAVNQTTPCAHARLGDAPPRPRCAREFVSQATTACLRADRASRLGWWHVRPVW